MNDQTTLYKLYNSTDELLYAGITSRKLRRFYEHAERFWWPEVSRIELNHFEDRFAAAAAEIETIRSLQPKYNLVRYDKPEPFVRPRFKTAEDSVLEFVQTAKAARRKDILNAVLDYGQATVDTALSRLIKKGKLFQTRRGEYRLCPK